MKSREEALLIDGKEIEFPTKFVRFVHRRKKMFKIIFDQKIRKADCPCLAYAREKTRQIRDYTKKKDWIYLVS